MRLTEFEIENIKSLAICHFGEKVEVVLFGSRTHDEKRGGDIDLFIKPVANDPTDIRRKINFLSDLILRIGDQKIDVVLDHAALRHSQFYKTIQQTGIRIC